ncbi:MAG TPA: hypothetical protein VKM72_00815 [Thermoanaerobaculia bacterium]|nr:hypothetical protein [Thermoanaerobaculia bacterium]
MFRWSSVLLLSLVLFVPAGKAVGATTEWPSLDAQLLAGDVVPGSALEALIAGNQDFSLLRPEEAKDGIRIPLWLRVLWREAHPEMEYSGDDPTGGYPLVLKEVYQWMITHQDLLPGLPEQDTWPDRAASVTGEVRISGAQSAPRSESDIRVNYWDPQKIVGASNNLGGSGNQAQFYSLNGGASWSQTTLPLQVADSFHSDPTVDWTSDGTAWSTTIGINATGTVLQMRSYKSVNNGATWTFDATFSGTQTDADKQLMWVDHSATSPYKDNIYAIWHNGTPAFMNRRTGPGGSWQTPIQVSGAESTGTAIGADVKTNAFGDVFGFWPTTGNRKIFVVKSTNGGVSYGTPVQIATTFDGYDIGVPSFNSRRILIYVSGGAYRTVAKNMVYAAWADLTGATGCTTSSNEPGSNVSSTCKTRIWFSRSTNGGATWSAPVMINNQASLNDQFNQALVVDETTGALGIIYYDTVGNAGRKKVDVWYQSSFDDGATWGAAVKVTSAQTDETVAGADTGNQFGDYNSLSGIAGVFFPSWTDRRNNAAEEIWTAKITDTACTPTGAPAIGTASATGPNQIQVTWGNGSPASTTFNVYRAIGTCAAPGTFSVIAPAVAGSPYTDGTVSGGTTYAYRVTGRDGTGSCESAPSACVQATATGVCTLAPSFAGLASVTNNAAASCGLTLAWSAATPSCAGPVAYTIYRSTSPGFTPGPGNLIASGVTGASYADTSASLASGTTYYYAVRAVDLSNNLSESNSVLRSATPTGPIATSTFTETFEGALSGGGFDNAGWTHNAVSGLIDWVQSTAQSQTPTHSWFSDSQAVVSDRVLVSPSFVPQASTALTFWHTYEFETNGTATTCFDAGTLEISTNGGTTWTVVPDADFTAGGFNGTVSSGFFNPLGGKRAWCQGTIGAMTQVNVNLSSYAGSSAKLRWHQGDDESFSEVGWYVDSVTISNLGSASACTPAVETGASFYAVPPCRLVDTRTANGAHGGPALQPSANRMFVLAGVACNVPAGAKAVALNLTVLQAAAAGYLTLFPSNQSAPITSSINFEPGVTRSNNAVLGLATDGSGGITVKNGAAGTVHFILDVTGYFQ